MRLRLGDLGDVEDLPPTLNAHQVAEVWGAASGPSTPWRRRGSAR
jgi:hypothetical protein